MERRLIPDLGYIPLAQLQASHLQGFYAQLLKNGRRDGKGGLSARTVQHHHRVISEALGHAVKWGLVGRNVALAVDPPKPKQKEMRAMGTEEVHRLLKAAEGTIYYPAIHLALFTGLRRSELLGLRWQDIDLNMVTLSVSRAYQRLPGGRDVFEPPKSAKSRRQVALPPTAVLSLKAHLERQQTNAALLGGALSHDTRVFTWEDGQPILPLTFSHAFRRIARRAGLEGVRLHDSRHTHASLMLAQGVHPKIVQERLGHSSISVTLDTYSHVAPIYSVKPHSSLTRA